MHLWFRFGPWPFTHCRVMAMIGSLTSKALDKKSLFQGAKYTMGNLVSQWNNGRNHFSLIS